MLKRIALFVLIKAYLPEKRVEPKSCHIGGCKNSFSPQKQYLTALFLIYHANPEKQSRINKFGSFIPQVSN